MSLSVRVSGQAEFSQIKREVRDLDRNLKGLENTIKRSAGHGFFPKEQARMAEHTIKELIQGQTRLNRLLDEQRTKLHDLQRQYDEADEHKKKQMERELNRRKEIVRTYENELEYMKRKTTELQKQASQTPVSGVGAGVAGAGVGAGVAGTLFSSLMRISGIVLGLAGVGGILSTALRGIELAGQEQTSFSRLAMRTGRAGDVQSYLGETRETGLPYGYTAVQGAQMMEAFTQRGGAMTMEDLEAIQQFSRGFGLEGTQTAGTFAEARRMGTFGEGEQKKFANMLAIAIDQGRMQERAVEAMESTVGLLGDLGRRLPEVSGAGVVALQTLLNQSGIEGLRGERGADIISRLDSMFESGDTSTRFFTLRALGWGQEGGLSYYEAEKQRELGITDPTNLAAVIRRIEMGGFGYSEEFRNMEIAARAGLNLHQVEALREATGPGFEGLLDLSPKEYEDLIGEKDVIEERAEHWSDTLGGRFETSTAMFEQAVTDLGTELLPAVLDIKNLVTNTLNSVNTILGNFEIGMKEIVGTALLGGGIMLASLKAVSFGLKAILGGSAAAGGSAAVGGGFLTALLPKLGAIAPVLTPFAPFAPALQEVMTKKFWEEHPWTGGFFDEDFKEKDLQRKIDWHKDVITGTETGKYTLSEDAIRDYEQKVIDLERDLIALRAGESKPYEEIFPPIALMGGDTSRLKDVEHKDGVYSDIVDLHYRAGIETKKHYGNIETDTTDHHDKLERDTKKYYDDVYADTLDFNNRLEIDAKRTNELISSEIETLKDSGLTAFESIRSAGKSVYDFFNNLFVRNVSGFSDEGAYNPFSEYRINSPFGWRNDPITGERRFHAGIDIGMPHGTPLESAGAGIVERIGYDPSGYGQFIDKRLDTGELLRYAHLSQIGVEHDQRVGFGDILGATGGDPVLARLKGELSPGKSTGPHLHFEKHNIEGERVDPTPYLDRLPDRNLNIKLNVEGKDMEGLTLEQMKTAFRSIMEEIMLEQNISGTVMTE